MGICRPPFNVAYTSMLDFGASAGRSVANERTHGHGGAFIIPGRLEQR